MKTRWWRICFTILGIFVCLLYMNNGAMAQQEKTNRYVIYVSSKSPASSFADVFLLDTWTGKTWRYQCGDEIRQLMKLFQENELAGKELALLLFSGRWASVPFHTADRYQPKKSSP